MNFRILTIFLLFTLTLIVMTSCSSVTKKTTEEAVEKSTGVEVGEENGSVTVETEEGQAEIKGQSGKLPEKFPKNFPIFEGVNKFDSSQVDIDESVSFTVHYLIDEKVSKVADFYKKSLPESGYTVTSSMEVNDSSTFSVEKGEEEKGNITIGVDEEEGKTKVIISLEIEK